MNDIEKAALKYTKEYGFGVIPLKRESKVPALEKGHPFLNRQATVEEVDGWDFGNVGVVTGEVSGIIVLDVENKHGRNGMETIRERGWEIPYTPTAKTTNDGRHVFFKHPGFHVKNRTGNGEIAPGVEVKGDSGYVVASPSVVKSTETDRKGAKHKHTGVYEWVVSPDEVEIAECPDWLLEALRTDSRASHNSSGDFEQPIYEGSRNDTLSRLAGKYARDGLDSKSVREMLHVVNRNQCKPPLSDEEIDGITIYDNAPQQHAGGEVSRGEEIGTLASEVQPEKVDWLWEDRIPLGKITILDGDPSLGKSLITTDLAARVSTGRDFPNGDCGVDGLAELRSCGVVMMSAEDGVADTIRPRLDVAGADATKIVLLSTADMDRSLSLPEDIGIIEKAIDRVDAKLVIIDPFMAFLSPTINANSDQQVRQCLSPLKSLAENKGVAIVLVRHLNKKEANKAMYRGGSSIGIVGAARVGLVVERHPDDEDTVVLATIKNNLAYKASSLTYSVDVREHGGVGNTPYVKWGKRTHHTADDLFNVDPAKSNKEEQAAAWLKELLKDGPKLQEDIKALVEEHGRFSYRTVEEAKKSSGIESKRKNNKSWWQLSQVRNSATPQSPLDYGLGD